jgi:hypothetical protein
MPVRGGGYFAWILAGWLALVVLLPGRAAWARLSYNGTWQVEENEDGRLLQSYRNTFGANLEQQLTERLRMSENMIYGQRWQEQGGKTMEIMPGSELLLANDLFSSTLGVNSTRRTDRISGREDDSDRLSLNWSSQWDKKWFAPSLMLYGGMEQSQSGLGKQRSEREAQNLGGDLTWQGSGVMVFYNYGWNRAQDPNSFSESESEQSLARVNASRNWWQDRVRLGLGFSYNESTSGQTQVVDQSGVAILPRPLVEVRTGNDPTPADAIDTVAVNNLMRDGDLLTSAYAVAAGDTGNNLLLATGGQDVNLVYLYTSDSPGLNPAGLTWRLYTTNVLGSNWNPPLTPAVDYDTINRRFVIRFPNSNALYLKLVVDLSLLAPNLDFTEVVANREIMATSGSVIETESRQNQSRSNLNLQYNPNASWDCYYSFALLETATGGYSDEKQQLHRLGWNFKDLSRSLDVRINFGLTRDSRNFSPTEQDKDEKYVTQLEVRKVFLPTLSASVTIARNETRQDGDKVGTGNQFDFYADARLYPDLSTRFESSYHNDERVGDDGADSGSDRVRLFWQASLRARPSLTFNFSDRYELTESHAGTRSVDSNTVSFNCNWQVSDAFRFNGQVNYSADYLDADSLSAGASAGISLGPGSELQLNYSMSESDRRTQAGEIRLLKNFLGVMRWTTFVQYRRAEGGTVSNQTKFFSELQVNFATN